jgi:hypothetical protein
MTTTATYTYTIRTDAVLDEIEAASMDAAAVAFAAGEDLRGVTDTDSLLAAYARIGDGAWIWIESEHAPDGARRF